jgi:predicted GIY-YIG superfamily endonuclease
MKWPAARSPRPARNVARVSSRAGEVSAANGARRGTLDELANARVNAAKRTVKKGAAVGSRFYFVYLLTNKSKTVLYTGVTNSLERRIWQHKNHVFPGFSAKYNCDRVVHIENFGEIDQAIAREKQIKGWARRKKNALVTRWNPEWRDLSEEWMDPD